MKMQEWTADIVRFMNDASENTDYFSKLADCIVPYLKDCKTVCDAGCGLGHLSFELAKRGFTVYACDINQTVIDYIKSKNAARVIPLKCDLENWMPQVKFDAIVFNYFGSVEETFDIASRCCKKRVIAIKKDYKNHISSFSHNVKQKSFDKIHMDEFLDEKGIIYETKQIALELGQPFKNIDDALLFYSIYNRDENINIDAFKQKLVPSELPGFEYYLPHTKDSLIYSFTL